MLPISTICASPLPSPGKLSGGREGQYSIRINEQWRICFEWRENNAYGVEIVDYH